MTVDADYSSSFVQHVSLAHSHIADALARSPDHGASLVLSKLNISDVGPGVAQALASIGSNGTDGERAIERLAVAHNRLFSLPAEFTHLTYLRYINLKHNQFTVFPHILTTLASLETLDISHNKISGLPVQPGQLVNLKVLCLSRNKLTSVPSYIIRFNKLEVLQIDRNPLEWPPTTVINGSQGVEPGKDMKEWIQSLKKWIEMNPKDHIDEEPSYFDLGQETHWQYPDSKDSGVGDLSHARSFSADSSLSFSSIPESISNLVTSVPSSIESQRPPPLHLGILRPYSEESMKSFHNYTDSPADSESFDEPSFTTSSPNWSFDSLTQHNRNASYAGQEKYPHRTEVIGKMSMPDLRLAKLDFAKKTPALPQTPQYILSTNTSSPSNVERTPRHQASVSIDSDVQVLGQPEDEYEDGSTSRALFSMTSERNSYFRRLSTSPALTSLPQSLLCLVDSARSLLFAACQVYQTLDHYTMHVVDERLSSVLRKVLEPASSDMVHLIASLDQFDAWSRKTLPPPVVCRAVVESCRDTAAAFNKVVRVLTLQLQVLTTSDDIRYSRLLLLELFAATAEIACAWKNMVPEIPHLKKLLHPIRLAGQATSTSPDTKSKSTAGLPVPLLRQQPNGSSSQSIFTSVTRARTVRRHAGSFSSKDVEIGKQLPSYDVSYGSSLSSSAQGRGQVPHTPRRQATSPAALTSIQNIPYMPPNPIPTIRSISRGPEAIERSHSRQDSRSSLPMSSVSPSPPIPNKAPTFLDIPSSSKIQIDREALQAVKNAVDIAPMVWDMIETYFSDILPTRADVRDGIKDARDVTNRLADVISVVYENDDLGDKKTLREDARLFLKAVVQLSNAIKNHKDTQDVPLSLRTNMVKLTNATEEFAILLHVSSFSPSTPRSFSPIVSNIPTIHATQHSDDQLESSLSRSKSARSPLSIKVHAAEYRDGPRSALPTQSFKVSTIKRIRGRDI